MVVRVAQPGVQPRATDTTPLQRSDQTAPQ
jgi:hypothetical protein